MNVRNQYAVPPHGRRRNLLLIATAVMAIGGLTTSQRPALADNGNSSSDQPPVPVLDWQPCTSPSQAGLECATAQVPFDYSDPHGRTITLAVIRHRATNSANRIGTIFFNPGGPGGQGTVVLPLLLGLPPPPPIFPEELRERFDLVSWDPRGTGASTPVKCFDSVDEEEKFIATLPQGVPVTPAERSAWIAGYAYIAQLCGARNGALLEHVSTADTAKDLDLLRQAVGDQYLNYIGDSYGTFLGATYANLFPDRVRAMVLQGNVNAPEWPNVGEQDSFNGSFLGTFMRQGSDKGLAQTLDAFLSLCGKAPTDSCAFSAGSPVATWHKWNTLLQNVLVHPVTLGAVTWNYDAVVTTTSGLLYEVANWTVLANTLEQIWEGRAVSGNSQSPPSEAETFQVPSQSNAIRCAESPNPSDPQAYSALADLAEARSGAVGPYWTWIDEQCAGWPAAAADRYTGPWNQATANPVLLVNTTNDPATPYSAALAMEHTLANARLLTVEGYGHVLGGRTSSCVNSYVISYFVDNLLPPDGTVCRQDEPPFTTGSGT